MGSHDDMVGQRAVAGLPFHQRVSAATQALASRQKPGAGVPAYMRWVNRGVARYLAATAFVLGLSPNFVTVLSACFSILALTLLVTAPASGWLGLAVAIILAIAFALDSADGQLARLAGVSGPAGEWFDHVVDAFRAPALHLAVAVAAWLQFENTVVAGAGLLLSVAISAQFMSQILAEQLRRGHRPVRERVGSNRQSWILLPTDPGIWAWSFVLWGWPQLFAVTYTTLTVMNLVHIAVSLTRRYQDLSLLQGA